MALRLLGEGLRTRLLSDVCPGGGLAKLGVAAGNVGQPIMFARGVISFCEPFSLPCHSDRRVAPAAPDRPSAAIGHVAFPTDRIAATCDDWHHLRGHCS